MPRKKKGHQADTTPQDRAEKSRTFKLTPSQNDKIIASGVLKETTFSNLARDALFSYIDNIKSIKLGKNLKFSSRDIASSIGNGVDAESVSDLIIAWIGSKPLPAVIIDDAGLRLYAGTFASDGADNARLAELCFEYIKEISDVFFNDYTDVIALLDIDCRINLSNVADDIKGFSSRTVERISHKPIDAVVLHARYSPDLRFVTYLCYKYGMFKTKVCIPDHIIKAEQFLKETWGFEPSFAFE